MFATRKKESFDTTNIKRNYNSSLPTVKKCSKIIRASLMGGSSIRQSVNVRKLLMNDSVLVYNHNISRDQ